jgi:hypothetical protein
MAADVEKIPIDPAWEFLRFVLYRVAGDPAGWTKRAMILKRP